MRYSMWLPLFLMLVSCGSTPNAPQPPPPSGQGNPFAVHALPAASQTWREGDVVERVAAGPYVYLRLRESNGRSTWLASLRATTPAQNRVRALVVGQAAHFHSRRLNREFTPLAFAAVRSAAH